MFGASQTPLGGASGGGLFGATPAPSPGVTPSSGLFGAQPTSTPSLFGATPASTGFGAQSSSSIFGAPASGGSLFGAASTGGLFSTSSAPPGGIFGAAPAASGGLFGAPAASSGSLFGAPASSGGLFGAQASSGGLFGAPASSGGLFGTSSPSLFGASSAATGLFGAPAASGGLFGASTPSLFGTPAASGGPFGAGTPGVGAVAVAAPAQQAGHQLLTGKDQTQVGRKTAFENLPDQMQQFMLQMEEKVRRHRHDAAALDGRMATRETVDQHRAMTAEAKMLHEALAQAYVALEGDVSAADSFKDKVLEVVKGTEQAAFVLRVNKARREHIQAQSTGQQHQQQVAVNSELLNASAVLPSPYLRTAVSAFGEQFKLLRGLLASLETLVPLDGPLPASGSSAGEQLPEVLRSMHDYFIHVAACVARMESRLSAMRAAYLRSRQAQGDFYDPFAHADERDTAQVASTSLSPGNAGGNAGTGGVSGLAAPMPATASALSPGTGVFGASGNAPAAALTGSGTGGADGFFGSFGNLSAGGDTAGAEGARGSRSRYKRSK